MGKPEIFLHELLEQPNIKSFPKEGGRMYAIAFDLDTNVLKQIYPNPSWQNAYKDVRAILAANGFTMQQGSVYFGTQTTNAVQCVMTAQQLSRTLPWFKQSVIDIRMLRIEEFNDLGPAL